MPSLDAGTSTPKRGIRTMLMSIHTTSIQSLCRNSSLRPYELPTSLLWFSKQALSLMSSSSMLISSPCSPLIHWLPSICPPPNQPPLVGQSTLTVSSISTTISMSPTPMTSIFVFFTISTITPLQTFRTKLDFGTHTLQLHLARSVDFHQRVRLLMYHLCTRKGSTA